MKIISTILLLVFTLPFSILSPITRTGQVKIHFIDCRENDEPVAKLVSIKSETGETIDTVISPKRDKIKKLKPGKYEMEFTSLFGLKEVESFEIVGGDKVQLSVCIDKFTADAQPILPISHIDSLALNEKFQITYVSRGCFHILEDSIQVMRKAEGFYLKHSKDWLSLTDEQVNLIRDFELKLVNGRFPGGCTTQDLYAIKFREDYGIGNIDGSCRWRGFKYLMEDLNIDLCKEVKLRVK